MPSEAVTTHLLGAPYVSRNFREGEKQAKLIHISAGYTGMAPNDKSVLEARTGFLLFRIPAAKRLRCSQPQSRRLQRSVRKFLLACGSPS